MLYFFHGENTYAVRQKINELIKRYRKTAAQVDFGLHRFDESHAPEQVVSAMTMQPMFADNSLVIIENPSRNQALQEVLRQNIARIPESIVVVIHEESVDKRTKWFKELTSQAKTVEFAPKREYELIKWIRAYGRSYQADIDTDTARFLLEWAGTDQWRLSQEIEKLATGAQIDENTIRSTVMPSPRHTIFELLDALAQGDIQRALDYLDDLFAQNIHELEIMTMLGWQLRSFLAVMSMRDAHDKQIAKKFAINPFVVKKARPVVDAQTEDDLLSAYRTVIEADYRAKQGHAEPRMLLEETIIRIGGLLKTGSGQQYLSS